MKKEHIDAGNIAEEDVIPVDDLKILEVDRIRKCPKCQQEFNLGDELRKQNDPLDWFPCSKCGHRLLSPKSVKQYRLLSQQKIDVRKYAEKYNLTSGQNQLDKINDEIDVMTESMDTPFEDINLVKNEDSGSDVIDLKDLKLIESLRYIRSVLKKYQNNNKKILKILHESKSGVKLRAYLRSKQFIKDMMSLNIKVKLFDSSQPTYTTIALVD